MLDVFVICLEKTKQTRCLPTMQAWQNVASQYNLAVQAVKATTPADFDANQKIQPSRGSLCAVAHFGLEARVGQPKSCYYSGRRRLGHTAKAVETARPAAWHAKQLRSLSVKVHSDHAKVRANWSNQPNWSKWSN